MVEIVGLISGGKDSIYNLIECVRNGHQIVALANLKPPKQQEEIDSFMYQTVGNNLIEIIANECLQLPLFQVEIKGTAESKDEHYIESSNDEVEDLYRLLKSVKDSIPTIKGVSCGAILSTYQRIRVENVCSRLGLVCYSYLWMRDQDTLLQEMISSQMNAVLIKVASIGLVPNKHLLKSIQQLYPVLKSLNTKYGVHICGEGGEYESIVLDCPLYKKKINVERYNITIHSDDAFSQVAYCSIQSYSTTEKSATDINNQQVYLDANYIKRNNLNISNYKDLKLINLNNFNNNTNNSTQQQITINHNSNNNSNKNINYKLNLNKNNNYFSISSYSINNNDGQSNYTTGQLLEQALEEISNILKENSLSIEQLLYCNLYLNDMNEFGLVNQSYYKFFKSYPASRACIQVNLADQDKRFLIDCFGCTDIKKKSILHVQSISNWAPACIGPYSQANILDCGNDGQYTFLAGQIAMIPSNLDLNVNQNYDQEIDGERVSNEQIQLEQILLNTNNLLDALKVDYSNVIQSTIFVSEMVSTETSNEIINYLYQFLNQESVNNNNLIQLLKVPRLPKNADIEILFTLYKEKEIMDTDDQDEINNNKSIETQLINQLNNSLNINSNNNNNNNSTTFKITKSYIHSNLSINGDNNSNDDQLFISIENYAKDLLSKLETTLSQSNKSIIYIKFYYLESLINLNIMDRINELMSSYNSLCSYVPVREININNKPSIIQSEIFLN